MAVPDDVAVLVQVLRRRVVVGAGVHEEPRAQVAGLDGHGEGGVGGEAVAGLGRGDDGGDHVGRGGDAAQRDAVAGAVFVLEAVGEGLAGAEVDKVCCVAGTGEVVLVAVSRAQGGGRWVEVRTSMTCSARA